jgi:5-formyltetrahydrofolate cyclo-ligase
VTAQAGSIIPTADAERRRLRKRLRTERRAVPHSTRAEADRAIQAHIERLAAFRSARRVAVFLAFDGEPSLARLIARAGRRGKRLYAPVLRGMTMTFAEIEPSAALTTNFFGILEPELGAQIDARDLDLVLTPLVAFDDRGTRIGVGRGYYDRCFRFLTNRRHWRRPKLLGVAYELQRVKPLASHPWDVPLWGVATEAGVQRF